MQFTFINKQIMKYNNTIFNVSDTLNKGIYYLYNDNKIVYVGKSDVNVMKRISMHFTDKTKNFNRYKIEIKPELTNKQLESLEKKLIKRLTPIYNKIHNHKHQLKHNYDTDYKLAVKLNQSCQHEFKQMKTNELKEMCIKCGRKRKLK